jgi:hypothetical protein
MNAAAQLVVSVISSDEGGHEDGAAKSLAFCTRC